VSCAKVIAGDYPAPSVEEINPASTSSESITVSQRASKSSAVASGTPRIKNSFRRGFGLVFMTA
jgi:hypothetical protein